MTFDPCADTAIRDLRQMAALRASLWECLREVVQLRCCLYESASLDDGSVPDPDDQGTIDQLDAIIDRAQGVLK